MSGGIPAGYNPLRWDCGERGCYNKKHRPKIELFSDCFPGRISFGDVDGIVEIKGNFLLLEWKSEIKDLPAGQRIMYERMTIGRRFTVFVVTGNAETMDVVRMGAYIDGKRWPDSGYRAATLAQVKRQVSLWAAYAEKNPRIGKV